MARSAITGADHLWKYGPDRLARRGILESLLLPVCRPLGAAAAHTSPHPAPLTGAMPADAVSPATLPADSPASSAKAITWDEYLAGAADGRWSLDKTPPFPAVLADCDPSRLLPAGPERDGLGQHGLVGEQMSTPDTATEVWRNKGFMPAVRGREWTSSQNGDTGRGEANGVRWDERLGAGPRSSRSVASPFGLTVWHRPGQGHLAPSLEDRSISRVQEQEGGTQRRRRFAVVGNACSIPD